MVSLHYRYHCRAADSCRLNYKCVSRLRCADILVLVTPVKTATPAEIKNRIAGGEALELIDVREQEEIAIASLEGARAFFADQSPAFAVMTRPYLDELLAQGLPLQVEYEREGMWVTSGRALWRRRETPTRFVIVSRKMEP